MIADTEDLIRERAHRIWENEGRPDGRAEAHWDIARAEVAGVRGSGNAKRPAAAKPAKAAARPVKTAAAKSRKAATKTKTSDQA